MLIKILNGFDDVIISGNEDTIENKSGTIRIIIYSDPSHFINKHVLDSNEKIDNDQSYRSWVQSPLEIITIRRCNFFTCVI